MPQSADRSRRYTDQEVALIIKRAAELQEADPADATRPSGMSLAELEQVAREAGLDPTLVRRAAREFDTRAPEVSTSKFLGGPSTIRLERTVEGEAPLTSYELLVEEIRRSLDDPGFAGTVGRTLTWTSTMSGRRGFRDRRVAVTVTARDGCTTIRVEESMQRFAHGVFGLSLGVTGGYGGMASMGVGVGVLHSALAALSMWGGIVSGGYLLARTLYGAGLRARTRQLETLMARLVERVELAVGESGVHR